MVINTINGLSRVFPVNLLSRYSDMFVAIRQMEKRGKRAVHRMCLSAM